MKKIIIALMLSLALVMTVLTGCGGEEQKPAENDAVNTDAETVPETEAETETEPEAEQKEETAEEANDVETETVEENAEENSEENAEENAEEPVEEPKLAEDIAVNPEKAEEVVNNLEFVNVKLLSGIANAIGKATAEMTQEDIEAVSYLGISKEKTGDYTVYVGMQDYMEAYAQGNNDPIYLEQLLKKSVVEFDESDSFEDVAKFKGIQTFELYEIPIADVSFIKELPELAYGFFNNNGITDVSALAGYDTEKLKELDFTGNDIADWTPLHHIKEKVIISFVQQEMTDANGEKVVVPMTFTLEDKIAQDEAKAAAETEESTQAALVDQNGNPADFSSLFE